MGTALPGLAVRLGLTGLLLAIALVDLRSRQIPLRLSLPVLAAGYLTAVRVGALGALLAGVSTLVFSDSLLIQRLQPAPRIGLGLLACAGGLWVSRAATTALLLTLAWTAVWLLWEVNILGGGDALVFSGLVGLFPDVRFIGLTLGVVIVAGSLLLLLRYGTAAFYLIPLAVQDIIGIAGHPSPPEILSKTGASKIQPKAGHTGKVLPQLGPRVQPSAGTTILALTGRSAALPTRAERDERGQPVAFMLALAGSAYLWLFGVAG